MKKKTAILKEVDHYSKEVILIRCYAVQMRDEEGTVTYTFTTNKKADEFYEVLKGGNTLSTKD
jgi:hypothetical protein